MSEPCRYCNYPSDGEYLCNPTDPNACGPCQRLSALERRIKEIRKMLVGMKSERQQLKEQANHIHDRWMHRLPPEITTEIFKFSIPGEDEDPFHIHATESSVRYMHIAPLILSAVCRRWRSIALSTPQVWITVLLCPAAIGSRSFPIPSVIKDWIERAGKLPLSISLDVDNEGHVRMPDYLDSVIPIINLLTQYSNRWKKLKYTGPSSFLPRFSSSEQNLQLRMLNLISTNNDSRVEDVLELRTSRLEALSITSIRFAAVNIDWQHLTQLVMKRPSLSECLEALRRAPRLTRCIFGRPYGAENNDFPLPQHPIVHPNIQCLEISAPLHRQLFEHVSCPSLKTLALNHHRELGHIIWTVDFLKRSGCSLERLSIMDAELRLADIAPLCQGIPTLQYLRAGVLMEYETLRTLLEWLSKILTVNGRKEPRYFPALRSLDLVNGLRGAAFDLKLLPNIFGTATAHSTERYRHALDSVTISTPDSYPLTTSDFVNRIGEVTLKRILSLKEAGVRWNIQHGQFRENIIELVANR